VNDRTAPLILITGFLGSGKTTVMNDALAQLKGHRVAVVEYFGRRLKVPAFYKDYLATIYGDWRTPRKDYKPQSDDGTIIGSLADLGVK
jgi:tRNA uridine 5-carbamoylmethylation protein Kti12